MSIARTRIRAYEVAYCHSRNRQTEMRNRAALDACLDARIWTSTVHCGRMAMGPGPGLQSASLLLLASMLGAPHGTVAGCTDALGCSLNGQCRPGPGAPHARGGQTAPARGMASGSCVCSPGWAGPECELLDLGPAPPGGAYGFHPNISAW